MATLTLRARARQLQENLQQVESKITSACENATIRAIEKAAELTPPTQDDLSGTNTRSGELKQHWATDSKMSPQVTGTTYTTYLNNDKEYASYVNDGHRMDRHFVPRLVINKESGVLEMNPDGKGGIVVGTKTTFVEGIFMVDKAKEEYRRVLRQELASIGEVFE